MSLTEIGSRLQKLGIENRLQNIFKKRIRRHLHYRTEFMHDSCCCQYWQEFISEGKIQFHLKKFKINKTFTKI